MAALYEQLRLKSSAMHAKWMAVAWTISLFMAISMRNNPRAEVRPTTFADAEGNNQGAMSIACGVCQGSI